MLHAGAWSIARLLSAWSATRVLRRVRQVMLRLAIATEKVLVKSSTSPVRSISWFPFVFGLPPKAQNLMSNR